MFSFKYSPRPNTLALKRLPDDVAEEEKTRRIVALQALQREIQGDLHEQAVGRVSNGPGRFPQPAARLGALGPHQRQHGRELRGRAGRGSASIVPVRITAANPNSLKGRGRAPVAWRA